MSNCKDIKTQRESAQRPGVQKSTNPKVQKDREKKLISEHVQEVQVPNHSQKKAQEY